MNEKPRQTLCTIIRDYGRTVAQDPKRCKALLLDLCGEHRREINVLVSAMDERIASDLLNAPSNVPHAVLLPQLAKRLHDHTAIAEPAARWAVESWALALGVITSVPTAPKPDPALKPVTLRRAGGELVKRPLHFIWIIDCSSSMRFNGKIEVINNAIREAIRHMRTEAEDNPNTRVLVRAITFSSGAKWHIAHPTPVEDFKWDNVRADGVRDMGRALAMVGEELKKLPERGLPPVLVLISDGQPTDDFEAGLNTLMEQPWGKYAVRIGIPIGADADLNVLQKFIGHPEFKLLQANNPDALVRHIKWVSINPFAGDERV